jgi:hypothetical protein
MPEPSFAIGDTVDWNKQGMMGTYRCRVVAVSPQRRRAYVVEILSHCWNANSPHIGERHAVSGVHLRHVSQGETMHG